MKALLSWQRTLIFEPPFVNGSRAFRRRTGSGRLREERGPHEVVIGAECFDLAAPQHGQVRAHDIVTAGHVEAQLAQQNAGPVRELGLVLAREEMGWKRVLRVPRLPIGGAELRERGQQGAERFGLPPPGERVGVAAGDQAPLGAARFEGLGDGSDLRPAVSVAARGIEMEADGGERRAAARCLHLGHQDVLLLGLAADDVELLEPGQRSEPRQWQGGAGTTAQGSRIEYDAKTGAAVLANQIVWAPERREDPR